MSYSQDFRDKVLEVKQQESLTISSTAKRFCIGTTTLKRWLKNPILKTTKNRPSTKIDLDALRAHVKSKPDAYHYERANDFNCSASGIAYAIKKLKISNKKTLIHPKRSEEKRFIFQARINEHKLAGRTIVSLDESGFAHDMPRTYGYSKIGRRCYAKHNWGAKGRTNVIAALLGKALVAVTLFTCNIDSDVFHQWVKCYLLPSIPKNCVIVMDNATFHKRYDTQLLIEKAGHIIEYLHHIHLI